MTTEKETYRANLRGYTDRVRGKRKARSLRGALESTPRFGPPAGPLIFNFNLSI